MSDFKLHEITLKSGCYTLLPKLNEAQLGILSTRLTDLGYDVVLKGRLRAKRGPKRIVVCRVGYAVSNEDAGDELAPAIPELLDAPKPRVPMDTLVSKYLQTFPTNARSARVVTRLESGALWTQLREEGGCALTPDEYLVAKALLESSKGSFEVLTDYPTDQGQEVFFGHRPYYLSRLECHEAAETLARVGVRREHGAYLPREGLIEAARRVRLGGVDWGRVLKGLGEWCGFQPD